MHFAASDLLWLAPVLAAAGVATGLLAGLFGVGGGGVIVPVLYQTLRFSGVDDSVAMPLAVGSSLAIIVPTSLMSARAHFSRGAVDMALVRRWAVPVCVGVLVGAALARNAPSALFKLVFVALCAFTAVRMLGGYSGAAHEPRAPSRVAEAASGAAIGLLSSLMGVGGAQLVNLYMSFAGARIHRAVGTGAAVGSLVSIPGAVGFMAAGWGKPGLPPGSVGYVSLAAFALIAPAAAWCAPMGARLAHRLTRRQLERAFGWFLVVVIARFLVSLVWKV